MVYIPVVNDCKFELLPGLSLLVKAAVASKQQSQKSTLEYNEQ